MRKELIIRLIALLLCLLMALPAAAEELLVAAPDQPDTVPYPATDAFGFFLDDDAYQAWHESVNTQRRDIPSAETLTPFLTASTQAVLTGSDGENRVYSPMSLYMALAMLAETTGGETREEILSLLGQEDIASLRQQASDLWNANYRNDGVMTRTLATSLWLNEDIPFRQETVDNLAGGYYASVYRGKMGSPELNAALQRWLNDNTLGLLTEQVQSITLPPDTAVAIASTVALSARWSDTFYEGNTSSAVFHTPDGDVTCDFMLSVSEDNVYWGERFMAAHRSFDQGGAMWFILPDEGVSVDDLLADAEALAFMLDASAIRNNRYVELHLSVPKFDVSSQLELSQSLQALGVTEVFDADAADFTPLSDSGLPISLSQVRHDARVAIDEEGCEAAAYTVMMLAGSAMPQHREVVELVLDRPFLFVITGAGGLPLFVGVVNEP
ncbi:MAG: hypothetical protein IJE07_07190 [Clostridia bacterium]|nr:hypothetical protein [Clostridia bacterium]